MTVRRVPTFTRPVAVLTTVLALGLVVLGGVAVYDRYVKEDSGIAACKAMRADRETAMDADGDGKFTEDEYAVVRDMFDDSRYEDIREHGRALVELVFRMTKVPDSEHAGSFVSLDEMADRATALQTACAKHGIVVNLMDN